MIQFTTPARRLAAFNPNIEAGQTVLLDLVELHQSSVLTVSAKAPGACTLIATQVDQVDGEPFESDRFDIAADGSISVVLHTVTGCIKLEVENAGGSPVQPDVRIWGSAK